MNVQLFTTEDQLTAIRPQWEQLTRGVPFRGWRWLQTWWWHFQGATTARCQRQLYVLALYDDDQLLALAPLYLEQSPRQGRVLRWLGSGEVCTDYQTVLCRPGWEAKAAVAIADFLVARANVANDPSSWHQLSLEGVDAEDAMMCRLGQELAARELLVYGHPDLSCWRIELPATWDEYLNQVSTSHRKQLRKVLRRSIHSGRAVMRSASNVESLTAAWPMLLDLHHRRRASLGETGCFAQSHVAAFHLEAAQLLAAEGRARLHWLEWDGRPVAIEYHLLGDGVTYAYQSGLEPAELRREPGRVLQAALIQLALAEGMRTLDLMRGDEPYKAHWRAQPRAALQLWVLPRSFASHVRHSVWAASDSLRDWMRGPLPVARLPNASTPNIVSLSQTIEIPRSVGAS
ncbi:MAG: GNAT family N-acetyltransferase [Planctomycetes bacterium]|nr:GNAT family N-acetyltransferase [Planctomycetota bacterium]